MAVTGGTAAQGPSAFLQLIQSDTFGEGAARSKNWLLKLAAEIYDFREQKLGPASGLEAEITSSKFVHDFLVEKYGLRSIADKIGYELHVTAQKYRPHDLEVLLFSFILDDIYDSDDFSYFVRARTVLLADCLQHPLSVASTRKSPAVRRSSRRARTPRRTPRQLSAVHSPGLSGADFYTLSTVMVKSDRWSPLAHSLLGPYGPKPVAGLLVQLRKSKSEYLPAIIFLDMCLNQYRDVARKEVELAMNERQKASRKRNTERDAVIAAAEENARKVEETPAMEQLASAAETTRRKLGFESPADTTAEPAGLPQARMASLPFSPTSPFIGDKAGEPKHDTGAEEEKKDHDHAMALLRASELRQKQMVTQYTAHIGRREERIAKLEGKLAAATAERNDAQSRVAEVLRAIDEVRFQAGVKAKQLSLLQAQYDTLRKEARGESDLATRRREHSLQHDLGKARRSASELEEKVASLEEDKKEREGHTAQLRDRLIGAQKEVNDLKRALITEKEARKDGSRDAEERAAKEKQRADGLETKLLENAAFAEITHDAQMKDLDEVMQHLKGQLEQVHEKHNVETGELVEQIKKLQADNSSLKASCAEVAASGNAAAQAELTELRETVAKLEKSRSLLLRQLARARIDGGQEDRSGKGEGKADTARGESIAAAKQVEELRASVSNLESQLAAARTTAAKDAREAAAAAEIADAHIKQLEADASSKKALGAESAAEAVTGGARETELVAKLRAEKESLVSRVAKLEKGRNMMLRQLSSSRLRKGKDKSEEEISPEADEMHKARQRNVVLTEDNSRLRQELDSAKGVIQGKDARLKRNEEELAKLAKRVGAVKGTPQASPKTTPRGSSRAPTPTAGDADGSMAKVFELEAELSQVSARLKEKEEQLASAAAEGQRIASAAQGKAEDLARQLAEANAELAKAKERASASRAALSWSKGDEAKVMEGRIATLEQGRKLLLRQVSELRVKEKKWASDINAARAAAAEAKKRCEDFEQQLRDLKKLNRSNDTKYRESLQALEENKSKDVQELVGKRIGELEAGAGAGAAEGGAEGGAESAGLMRKVADLTAEGDDKSQQIKKLEQARAHMLRQLAVARNKEKTLAKAEQDAVAALAASERRFEGMEARLQAFHERSDGKAIAADEAIRDSELLKEKVREVDTLAETCRQLGTKTQDLVRELAEEKKRADNAPALAATAARRDRAASLLRVARVDSVTRVRFFAPPSAAGATLHAELSTENTLFRSGEHTLHSDGVALEFFDFEGIAGADGIHKLPLGGEFKLQILPHGSDVAIHERSLRFVDLEEFPAGESRLRVRGPFVVLTVFGVDVWWPNEAKPETREAGTKAVEQAPPPASAPMEEAEEPSPKSSPSATPKGTGRRPPKLINAASAVRASVRMRVNPLYR